MCLRPARTPEHGPQYLWNTTQGGKSRAQNLRLGPELEKARQEVEKHQVFLRLCRELLAVNEKICRLRPAAEIQDEKELEALKKNCAVSGFGVGSPYVVVRTSSSVGASAPFRLQFQPIAR